MSVPPVPPPIVIMADGRNEPVRIPQIVTYQASAVRCADETVAPLRLEKPYATTRILYNPSWSQPAPAPYRLTFKIDADGRPHAIHSTNANPYRVYDPEVDGPAAALAASRFPPRARDGCSLSYTQSYVPIADAPPALIYETASMAQRGTAETELFRQARPLDSNCASNPRAPLRINYPDFDRIAQEPGTRAWTFLTFDVDRRGRTRNVRRLGSSGSASLDRAGLRAVSDNRYAAGPGYRGCVFYFYRNGEGLPPIEFPSKAPAETSDAACAIDWKTIAGLADGGAFPPAFLERKIEGIAAVSYDTAPWGAIGNIKILVSEPAEAFGEAARIALGNARVKENDVGHRGCVSRFRFKLPPKPGASG